MLEKEYAEKKIIASSLARDIMLLSRNSLLVNFRFLDRAVSRLELREAPNMSLAADGAVLYYGPSFILSLYREDSQLVNHSIFHSLMHCVFRHNFIGPGIDAARWNLAADIAVENMISSLASSSLRVGKQKAQLHLITVLKEELGEPLSAERIYRWLGEKGFDEDELERERENFIFDGHGIWYGAFDKDARQDENIDLKKIWEDVSRRMQTELETMNSDKDSALVQNLRDLNKARRSYTEFLKRFGVHGEILHISDSEFDYNYYTYGLELYGNIPLIEPLEYSEQNRIREFVIAIDTSGSVKGDVVQSFIQHTHDILMRRENFFTRVNMYIIQCDWMIRDVAHITSKEDFDSYLGGLEIKGLEKTDFRPVFNYVDQLINDKKLTRLQGLIYFTDGDGEFPRQMPSYDTAFIIHGDGFSEPDIPVWAQRLTISEEDILDKRF